MPQSSSLKKGTLVPNHIAIVPDGNRRWARARGLPTLQGHKKGFDNAVGLCRACREWGIHTVTLWGFSTENWDRSKEEVSYLMKIYERLIKKTLKEALREDVRIYHLGRKDRLPQSLMKKIADAVEKTKNNKKHIMNIALDHGGQDDIIRATQQMIEDNIKPYEVTKDIFDKYLDTQGQPYPYVDLIIRTSGEQRTSGFLLWQATYAETYWEQDHFPDFTPQKLEEAILDYSRRRRRFGGNDEIKHFEFKPKVAAKLEVAWWRLQNIPEGTRFTDYAMQHIREQFGLSKGLAVDATKLLVDAFLHGKKKKWQLAVKKLGSFYKIIREELKLPFEPSFVASLEIELWQKTEKEVKSESAGEIEKVTQEYLAEVYRVSLFQAAKAAHLRILAVVEKNLAQRGLGEHHWDRARDYLEKYYSALRDRVA